MNGRHNATRYKAIQGIHVKGTNITLYGHPDLNEETGKTLATKVWTASRDGVTVPGFYTGPRTALKAARQLDNRTITTHILPVNVYRAASQFDVEAAIEAQKAGKTQGRPVS